MPSDFIYDGYNEDGYVKAAKGFYGEHRFAYRPVTIQERAPVSDALKLQEEIYNRLAADLCAKKLQSWDFTDPRMPPGDKPLKITAANFLLLKPALINRMIDIILGWAASDPDPLKETNDARTGVEKEGADAKNS